MSEPLMLVIAFDVIAATSMLLLDTDTRFGRVLLKWWDWVKVGIETAARKAIPERHASP